MAQPEFVKPDFLDDETAEDIHKRMMNNLPADIDKMPGGFPYDMTKPTALEIGEMRDYFLVNTIMTAFPEYANDEWLDLHGRQAHVTRHEAQFSKGELLITGVEGTIIEQGAVFCTAGTDSVDSVEFETDEEVVIDETGEVRVSITALEAGEESNVEANTIILQDEPDEDIASVTNPEPTHGGTEEESDDDYYDRIAAEYASSKTYLGNDGDYVRWAKEAGAGDCIVSAAYDGPGTVKLVLVDRTGQPASDDLVETVYNYIVSPDDRTKRLLPTACAKLTCVSATTVEISFEITGLVYDETTDISQIKVDFESAVQTAFQNSKDQGMIRYNSIRPLISEIAGVTDFDSFTMNGATDNITLQDEEYPKVGTMTFTE